MLTIKDFQYLTMNTDNTEWFYNTGCQYPLVCPKGSKVKFKSLLKNDTGTWFEVEYKGEIRYILPCYMDGNVMIDKEIAGGYFPPLGDTVIFTRYTDRYGNKYLLKDKGELELL